MPRRMWLTIWAVLTAVAALVGIIVTVMVIRDRQREEQRLRDAQARHDAQVAQEAADRAEREQAEKDKTAKAAAAEAAHKIWIDGIALRYRGRSYLQLFAAIDAECSPQGQCRAAELEGIAAAGADDIDRARLTSHGAEKESAWKEARVAAERDAVSGREVFAKLLDRELLDEHLNPDRVYVSGNQSTTLTVEGAFCTRNFLYDLTTGESGAGLRKFGFVRVECRGTTKLYSVDL